MKNIRNKFKINSFTYVFLLVAFLSGYFKNVFLIFLIVFVHELGHVLFILHYEYPILKVEFFPFGGITSVEKPINTPLKQEIFISLAGVLFQILLAIVFYFLYQRGYLLEHTYFMFQNYNKVILLFNLLPMIPLDGSIFFRSILEYIFPFSFAYKIYLGVSLFFFVLFVTFHTVYSFNNYMILTFLFFKLYDVYKRRKFYENKFYLERYLYELPYVRIKSYPFEDVKKIRKDTLHFFWVKDRYLHEREILKKYYS